ncbi:outer membrane protein assembly factor BamB family protein [Pseudoduganella albidiflava]|uniref:Pyrrolo-quinoline quinone repeat domain-containing protein n=1 Tax=Pseudoduganella albidiflava TaxID=321983 RepID=A0A411WYC2_9BURK|nr:PQQ-binding-like beta-propeller repeat protein [Pseudoduganella albidiflava]QBI01696.1 hypothetical protein EYF70_13190 [Pseudoduganella albidiflava]GGY40381.1 hypothetical protein GCM10007387_23230 [Pseudoduganella albidiflava]
MNTFSRFVGGTTCALALAACGGGGGGGGTSTTPTTPTTPPVVKPDQSWLTLTPSSVDVTTFVGEAATVSITAKSSKTFAKPVNIGIIDATGVFSTDVKITTLSDLEYRADLQTSTVLPVGVRTATLELRLCEDDPKVCKSPLSGSPWLIPVKVDVQPDTNPTPLSYLPNVANWGTYQGNASHTGYVPATFDASKFTRRWVLPVSNTSGENVPVTHDNGRTFAVFSGRFAASSILVAVSEDTGKELWRMDFGAVHRVNPPAAAHGKVYLATSGHGDTFFWVFDQETGKLLSKTSMDSQWERYLAPTVYGDAVYTNSGYYGGMTKFSTTTFEKAWFAGLPQYDGWTPAVDASHAYTYVNGTLYALATADGSTAFTIADPDNQWSGYDGTTLALSGSGMAYAVNGGRLLGFDLAGRKIAWKANGTAVGMPAFAKDVVYVLNARGTVVEAHAAATGALQWTSESLGTGPYTQLVVTDNLVFVGSAERTVAIDLATQRKVWEYPFGGDLSISNRGVLYIAGQKGKVVAINLR